MSTAVYQHYLARKHMSWFSNPDGTNSFWFPEKGRLAAKISLKEIGGQNWLYESEKLPTNYVEKQVVGAIEHDFFAIRDRLVERRAVDGRVEKDVVKRYMVAQFLRRGYMHKRLAQLEADLMFLAKEMGLERYWGTSRFKLEERRRRASSLLAEGLLDTDEYVEMLEAHSVVYVNRVQGDLLLPDSGVLLQYVRGDVVSAPGFLSPGMVLLMPISPSAALKLVRLEKRERFRRREAMNDDDYKDFIQNLGCNAKTFITAPLEILSKGALQELPYLDPNAERLSMILQLARAGALDELVRNFRRDMAFDMGFSELRAWFFREKFIPALNRLFNPDADPQAELVRLVL